MSIRCTDPHIGVRARAADDGRGETMKEWWQGFVSGVTDLLDEAEDAAAAAGRRRLALRRRRDAASVRDLVESPRRGREGSGG